MSDKQKKFRPNEGYILAVYQNVHYIRVLAHTLNMFPEVVAQKLEEAGLSVQPDPFDLSADAKKVILKQEEEKNKGLRIVKEGENESSGDTPAN